MGLRQQAIEDWYCTPMMVIGQLVIPQYTLLDITCRVSLKSQAVLLFISDTFSVKHLMPSLLKEGTC